MSASRPAARSEDGTARRRRATAELQTRHREGKRHPNAWRSVEHAFDPHAKTGDGATRHARRMLERPEGYPGGKSNRRPDPRMMSMAWLLLAAAIASEVLATTAL